MDNRQAGIALGTACVFVALSVVFAWVRVTSEDELRQQVQGGQDAFLQHKEQEALASGNPHSRLAAYRSMALRGEAIAVERIAEMLESGDSFLAADAAEALGVVGGEEAVDALKRACRGGTLWGRLAATRALRAVDSGKSAGALAEILTEGDELAGQFVVMVLRDSPDRRLLRPLIVALRHDRPRVRASAAELLGALGDRRAVEPLQAAVQDADHKVHLAAAAALTPLTGRSVTTRPAPQGTAAVP